MIDLNESVADDVAIQLLRGRCSHWLNAAMDVYRRPTGWYVEVEGWFLDVSHRDHFRATVKIHGAPRGSEFCNTTPAHFFEAFNLACHKVEMLVVEHGL